MHGKRTHTQKTHRQNTHRKKTHIDKHAQKHNTHGETHR